MRMKKMRIELRERVKTTDEEFDSVLENNRPMLSETLHKKRNYNSKRRAMYNSESKDYSELYAEEF